MRKKKNHALLNHNYDFKNINQEILSRYDEIKVEIGGTKSQLKCRNCDTKSYN